MVGASAGGSSGGGLAVPCLLAVPPSQLPPAAGLPQVRKGDWITADGTTLGSDNGGGLSCGRRRTAAAAWSRQRSCVCARAPALIPSAAPGPPPTCVRAGIGVAAALALLDLPPSQALPPLEALFTVDEETGLTGGGRGGARLLNHGWDAGPCCPCRQGRLQHWLSAWLGHALSSRPPCPAPPGAFELDGGMLRGRTLLNLDTEDWGEVFIGCAGRTRQGQGRRGGSGGERGSASGGRRGRQAAAAAALAAGPLQAAAAIAAAGGSRGACLSAAGPGARCAGGGDSVLTLVLDQEAAPAGCVGERAAGGWRCRRWAGAGPALGGASGLGGAVAVGPPSPQLACAPLPLSSPPSTIHPQGWRWR